MNIKVVVFATEIIRCSPGQQNWCMDWTIQKRHYFTFKPVPNYLFRVNFREGPHLFVQAELLFNVH